MTPSRSGTRSRPKHQRRPPAVRRYRQTANSGSAMKVTFCVRGVRGEPCGMPRRLSRASVVRVFRPRSSVSSTGQSSQPDFGAIPPARKPPRRRMIAAPSPITVPVPSEKSTEASAPRLDGLCGLPALGTRQQALAILRPQDLEPHRHRGAKPQRVLAVIVIRAFGQRMHENVEAFAGEHQPRHDALELRVLENDIELRDRMRAARLRSGVPSSSSC